MVRKRQLLEDWPKVFTCNGERKYRADHLLVGQSFGA